MKPHFIFFLFIGFFIFCILLLNQYFQQDEWHSFGLIQSYGLRYLSLDKPLWQLFFADRVGARAIMVLFFNIFGVTSLPFAFLAIFVHTANTILVGLLAFKLSKKKIISFLAGVFFFTSSIGHQAYSWFGTLAGSSTYLAFILASLIFYFIFLEKRKYIYALLSIFFIWISFLFKESGYFIFAIYPVLWFLYSKKRSIKGFVTQNLPIFLYGFFMTLIFAANLIFIPGVRANYVTADSLGFIKLLKHMMFYPLEGVGQVFLPSQIVFSIARNATQIFFPTYTPETSEFDLFYTTIVAEGVSLLLSISLISLSLFVFKKYIHADKRLKPFFIFSLVLLLLSFLPYVVLDKFDAYLDSRYYYAALVGASFIFGILSFAFVNSIKSRLGKKIVVSTIVILVASHAFFLFTNLLTQAKISWERKNIVKQITTLVPRLNKKTVFYITGNNPGYYGIIELKVPFQSGLGQVLLVIYGAKSQANSDLFKEKTFAKTLDAGFLYDTLEQGYKEVDVQGFGYFYDRKVLGKALLEKQFEEKDIVSLFYDSDTKTMRRVDFN